MMRDLVIRAAGRRSLAIVAVLLVTTSPGSPAGREQAMRAGRQGADALVRASESPRFRSGNWIRFTEEAGVGAVVELELDALFQDMGARGGLVLDRDALTPLLENAVGDGRALEDVRASELLQKVRRGHIRLEGLSIPVGRPALRRLLQRLAGDTAVEDITVRELADRLEGVEVTAAGAAGLLDGPTVAALLGSRLRNAQRAARGRVAQPEESRLLRLRYDTAVGAARAVRRENTGDGEAERDGVYERAYDRLVADGQADAAPLLELHVELERELQRTQLRSMSRSERIAARWEARRRVFGEEMAPLLFGRDEAMERYEVDRLALEADPELSAEDKAARLADRRAALKVELAQQGSYVSFPGEARAGSAMTSVEPEGVTSVRPEVPLAPAEPAGRPGRRP